jgi:hypothetical protein
MTLNRRIEDQEVTKQTEGMAFPVKKETIACSLTSREYSTQEYSTQEYSTQMRAPIPSRRDTSPRDRAFDPPNSVVGLSFAKTYLYYHVKLEIGP